MGWQNTTSLDSLLLDGLAGSAYAQRASFTSTNRATTVPKYVAQIGMQTDDDTVWGATGLSAGNWVLIGGSGSGTVSGTVGHLLSIANGGVVTDSGIATNIVVVQGGTAGLASLTLDTFQSGGSEIGSRMGSFLSYFSTMLPTASPQAIEQGDSPRWANPGATGSLAVYGHTNGAYSPLSLSFQGMAIASFNDNAGTSFLVSGANIADLGNGAIGTDTDTLQTLQDSWYTLITNPEDMGAGASKWELNVIKWDAGQTNTTLTVLRASNDGTVFFGTAQAGSLKPDGTIGGPGAFNSATAHIPASNLTSIALLAAGATNYATAAQAFNSASASIFATNLIGIASLAAGATNYASATGGASIATVGTVTSGTWHGSIVAGTYGGTGVNNGTQTVTLAGSFAVSGTSTVTLASGATAGTWTLPSGSGTLLATNGIAAGLTGYLASNIASIATLPAGATNYLSGTNTLGSSASNPASAYLASASAVPATNLTAATLDKVTANGAVTTNAVTTGKLTINAAGSAGLVITSSQLLIAIGNAASATGTASTALGGLANAGGGWATAAGYNSLASGYVSTAAGYKAHATGPHSTAAGYFSVASGDSSGAFGRSATASGYGANAIGFSASATGSNTTAIGLLANASGNNSTAIGANASASVANQVVLGSTSQAVVVPSGVLRFAATNATTVAATGSIIITLLNGSTARIGISLT